MADSQQLSDGSTGAGRRYSASKVGILVGVGTLLGMFATLRLGIEQGLWLPRYQLELIALFLLTSCVGCCSGLWGLLFGGSSSRFGGLCAMAINGFAILGLSMLFTLPVGNPRFSCSSQIGGMKGACIEYATTRYYGATPKPLPPRGMFPELSPEPGRLLFKRGFYPTGRYTEHRLLCAFNGAVRGLDMYDPEVLMDDHSYVYLGYAVESEVQLRVFAEAYKQQIVQGLPFDDDLEVAEGQGTRGGNKILRLHADMLPDEEASATAGVWTDAVPVVIERGDFYREKGLMFRHQESGQRGTHVGFLTGPTRFVEAGQWPATQEVMKILKELDQLGPQPKRNPLMKILTPILGGRAVAE